MSGQGPKLVVFDDGRGELSPLTDLRPAFEIRTGALTTLERIQRALGLRAAALIVPEVLEELTREHVGAPGGPLVNELPAGGEAMLAINGRCPIPTEQIAGLEAGEGIVEHGSDELVAACGTIEELRPLLKGERPKVTMIEALDPPALLSRPWHFKAFRDSALQMDLHLLSRGATQPLPEGVLQIGDHSFTIDPEALVYPGVTLDLEQGSIVIAAGATVRPGAVISGPAYIGPGSTVCDRALIRGNTAIGPRCKVAGEVVGTIFQGLSNKAHEGFLGDSHVGEWVNLGAGTTNSNLLNTYQEVIAQRSPGSPRERTGETFLGCVLGDHVKTAICTRIMTGSMVHTGAMHAASVAISGCVGPFAWTTDQGRNHFRIEKFLDTARTQMARRTIEPSEVYVRRLTALNEAARAGSA
jgi:UDP-N-acetylglucosamine diphosphorylase/glucosamine-1-phosphate N-acetyltransferase